jgi:hypothetical protein
MKRKFLLSLACASFVLATGCAACHSCAHPWFRKNRRCDPCPPAVGAPFAPAAVPAGPPPGAVVVPAPSIGAPGPTPDAVVPAPPPPGAMGRPF